MSTYELIDPEVLPALDFLPDISLARELLPGYREASRSLIKLNDPAEYGIEREDVAVPGLAADQSEVRCLVYRPVKPETGSGAYLHFHGGGYILGSPDGSDERNLRLARALNIVIVSVDYRLAPEHPAPAGIEDGYAALHWMHNQAEELSIDPQCIAVGGESAGGGVAAALAQYAAKIGDLAICFQLLTYPMLDDRTGSESHPGSPVTGEFIWNREKNKLGWSYYLGQTAPAAPNVPARAESLAGLPPTWIGTAALDLFRNENIDYAQRLMDAGVATELVVYPGTFHGFQMATEARVTKQFYRDQMDALKRGIMPRRI